MSPFLVTDAVSVCEDNTATILLQLVYSVMETYIFLSVFYYFFDIVNIKKSEF